MKYFSASKTVPCPRLVIKWAKGSKSWGGGGLVVGLRGEGQEVMMVKFTPEGWKLLSFRRLTKAGAQTILCNAAGKNKSYYSIIHAEDVNSLAGCSHLVIVKTSSTGAFRLDTDQRCFSSCHSFTSDVHSHGEKPLKVMLGIPTFSCIAQQWKKEKALEALYLIKIYFEAFW